MIFHRGNSFCNFLFKNLYKQDKPTEKKNATVKITEATLILKAFTVARWKKKFRADKFKWKWGELLTKLCFLFRCLCVSAAFQDNYDKFAIFSKATGWVPTWQKVYFGFRFCGSISWQDFFFSMKKNFDKRNINWLTRGYTFLSQKNAKPYSVSVKILKAPLF